MVREVVTVQAKPDGVAGKARRQFQGDATAGVVQALTPAAKHDFRASWVPLPERLPGRLLAGPWPCNSTTEGEEGHSDNFATMRALLGEPVGVRCFVSLVSQPEVDNELGGIYQPLVQEELEELNPDADPVPCAQANVADERAWVGVVRWNLARKRLGQCTTFVVDQLNAGKTVYLHCADGFGRTGIVTAAVLGILSEGALSGDQAIEQAEAAYIRRRWGGPDRLTEEQRRMALDLLSFLLRDGGEGGASQPAVPAPVSMGPPSNAPVEVAGSRRKIKLTMTPETELSSFGFEFKPEQQQEENVASISSKPVTPAAEPAVNTKTVSSEEACPAQIPQQSEEDELEMLRQQRLAELRLEANQKTEEMTRRFEAHQRAIAQSDREFQQKRAMDAKGITVDALPSWAKGMAPRDPLTGASNYENDGGGGASPGSMVMRPTDAAAAAKEAQPAQWGFNPSPVAHADEHSAATTASSRSGV